MFAQPVPDLLQLLRNPILPDDILLQRNKSPHDRNAHLHRLLAAQHTRQHRHAMLGKGIGQVLLTSVLFWTSLPGLHFSP